MSARPRPRASSTGTVIAANVAVWTRAARKRGSPAASMKLPRPMNGRPSHGSRRSCPCSASQAVAAIGTSEPTRMKASAGPTSTGTSQRSSRASVRPTRVTAVRPRASPERARRARMSDAARCRAAVGRGLPAQGSMQLDLQDLRQFACRPASPAARPRRRARPGPGRAESGAPRRARGRRTASGALEAARRSAPARASARAR